jgi:hypothetical protein
LLVRGRRGGSGSARRVLPTGKLELVHIEEIYVATVQFIDNRWKNIDTD